MKKKKEQVPSVAILAAKFQKEQRIQYMNALSDEPKKNNLRKKKNVVKSAPSTTENKNPDISIQNVTEFAQHILINLAIV
jgi:phosphatidylethanolamine-binding protein (PEBP) family uncharacterized protein